MTIQQTTIEGLYIIVLKRFEDTRGYFMESFRHDTLQAETSIDYQIKQMSQAFNKQRGVLRGMHFQKEPHAETKLVGCVKGAIYDVALDLRPNSKTYGKWLAQELSEENNTLFFIPEGFAHGYQTLTDNVIVQYAMDKVYQPDYSTGIGYNDPAFNITWPIENPILSEKDRAWPLVSRQPHSE